MEIETLIAQITKEVYSRIQAENNGQDQRTDTYDLGKNIEYTLMDPRIRIDDIQQLCETAKQKRYACICVPQWFVAFAKDMVSGTDVRVCTAVGLPGGNSATEAKYAEVKQAVSNGLDEVDIPINMTLLNQENLEAVKRDIQQAMIPAKDKALVKAVIELGVTSKEKVTKAIKMLQECGIDFIVISNIISSRPYDMNDIKDFIGMCKDKMKVKVVGDIKTSQTANVMISAGVERIGTSVAGISV